MNTLEVMRIGPVIPVIVIDDLSHAIPLARALVSPWNNGAATMDAIRYLPFVGRLLIGLPFMMSGLSKVANYAGTIALIQSSTLLS